MSKVCFVLITFIKTKGNNWPVSQEVKVLLQHVQQDNSPTMENTNTMLCNLCQQDSQYLNLVSRKLKGPNIFFLVTHMCIILKSTDSSLAYYNAGGKKKPEEKIVLNQAYDRYHGLFCHAILKSSFLTVIFCSTCFNISNF